MRTKLATGLFLALLTTTPPHFAAIVALMVPTAPVKILLLLVFFAAFLASLKPTIKLAFSLNELLDSKFRLFFLSAELLNHSLQVEYLIFVVAFFFG